VAACSRWLGWAFAARAPSAIWSPPCLTV